MIDQKMRNFVQSYINIDTKINDLWNLCSILKSTYGEDAGKINIRDLFRLTVEPKPVELPVPRQPIGLGVEVKWSPDTVDDIVKERERKLSSETEIHVKSSRLLAETLLKLFGLGYFRVNGVIANRHIIERTFTDNNLPLKVLVADWHPVNVEIALRNLIERWCGTELNLREETDKKAFRFSLVSAKADFEKAREAQVARNPPAPRKWDTIDTKGIEKKSPPMKNSFHSSESYNNIAERIFVHFGKDFTIEDVRDELHVEITADDFGIIRKTGSLRRCLRRVGRDGNTGIWRIV